MVYLVVIEIIKESAINWFHLVLSGKQEIAKQIYLFLDISCSYWSYNCVRTRHYAKLTFGFGRLSSLFLKCFSNYTSTLAYIIQILEAQDKTYLLKYSDWQYNMILKKGRKPQQIYCNSFLFHTSHTSLMDRLGLLQIDFASVCFNILAFIGSVFLEHF